MKRWVLGALAFVGLALGIAGAAQAQARELVTFELDNGLKVALAPDDTVPKVAMYLRYRVGSMNEPAGRSGFAHLFEHLMFSGTAAWPSVFGAHLGHGNTINAWTSEDGTVYYAEGISANLPMILSLEADRMANLGGEVEQSELDLQRAVVKNEMRQNVLDTPGGAGWEAIWSGLFPKEHPYSRSVIGSMADLDAATLDDVRGFFNTYYLPNNAVLALVGDFEIEEARALVEQTFGVVPRGPDVATPDAPETAPTAIRIELTDRLPTAWMMLAHAGPRATDEANGALRLAAELLGNDQYGQLRQRIINDKALSSYVRAEWTPGLLGGRFTIDATTLPGVTPEALETELKAAVAEFLAGSIDPADLERARQTLLIEDRLAVEPYGDRAAAISEAYDILGDARLALADDPRIVAATADEVMAAARAVLDPSGSSVLVVRPGARGDYPAVLVESTGDPAPFTAPDRDVSPVPVLAAAEPREAETPEAEEATLSSGARLVHYRMDGSPMAYVAAFGAGGWDNAPADRAGLLAMAADMAYRGAGGRDQAAFARAAGDIGASIGQRAGLLATGVTLSVPRDRFAEGASLLADAVLRPNFDPAEWRRSVEARVENIGWDAADLANAGWYAAIDALQPATADRPSARWIADQVAAMTLDEAKSAYQRLFQPSAVTFVSVGPLPLEEVRAGLDKAFAGWADKEPGFTPTPTPPLAFSGRQVLVVPEPGASQSAILIVRPAPGDMEDGRDEAVAVMRLLGGDFTSRLNSVIREEKGYSYGVGAGLWDDVERGSGLYVSATVDRDNTGAAMEEFLAGFGSLATTPPTGGELAPTLNVYRSALAGAAETGAKLFSIVAGAHGSGRTLDHVFERYRRMTEVDLDDVQKAAPGFASLDEALIVVAGDAEIIVPQLEAIGFAISVLPVSDAGERTRAAGDLLSVPDGTQPPGGGGRTLGLCADGDFCERQP